MRAKKILAGILIIIFLMVSTDLVLIKIFKARPVFSLSIIKYKDGGSTEYFGIGYKIIKCNTLSGDKSITIGFYNVKYSCDTSSKEKLEFENDFELIVSGAEKCTKEKIITQEINSTQNIFDYKLYSYCVNSVDIKIGNNVYSLRYALEQKIIELSDLIDMLEKKYESGEIIKNIYREGGSTIYIGKNYALLKCNSLSGDRDYYVGTNKLEYQCN
jgi:hypothetical protein